MAKKDFEKVWTCCACGEEYTGKTRKWTCPMCGQADTFLSEEDMQDDYSDKLDEDEY